MDWWRKEVAVYISRISHGDTTFSLFFSGPDQRTRSWLSNVTDSFFVFVSYQLIRHICLWSDKLSDISSYRKYCSGRTAWEIQYVLCHEELVTTITAISVSCKKWNARTEKKQHIIDSFDLVACTVDCFNFCRDWFCNFLRMFGLMTCVQNDLETDWSLFWALI